jgi:hypothetical protein
LASVLQSSDRASNFKELVNALLKVVGFSLTVWVGMNHKTKHSIISVLRESYGGSS